MKKHELLKHAYDNYPKGTNFTWGGKTIISTGVFRFEGNRIVNVRNENSKEKYEFDLYDPQMINKWAEIIEQPKSILDGKVAIQVNNEREFELLMKHYEEKGWKWLGNDEPLEKKIKSNLLSNAVISYENEFTYGWENEGDFHIIPFAEFAAEIGIEAPVFIMKSEDGVDLYRGDEYYAVKNYGSKWRLFSEEPYPMLIPSVPFVDPTDQKAFSTREAAKKWIDQQNKPKEIFLFQDTKPTRVTKDGFGTEHYKKHSVDFTTEELEQINAAIQQLKGGDNGKD